MVPAMGVICLRGLAFAALLGRSDSANVETLARSGRALILVEVEPHGVCSRTLRMWPFPEMRYFGPGPSDRFGDLMVHRKRGERCKGNGNCYEMPSSS